MKHARRGWLVALAVALLGLAAVAGLGVPTVVEAEDLESPYEANPSTIDLGQIEYDSTTAKAPITITLTDVSNQDQDYYLRDLENLDTPYFSVTLSSHTMKAHGQVTATLTPKAHVKTTLGAFTKTISWMPQLSGNRIPAPITVKGELVKNNVTVSSIDPIDTFYYSQSVNYGSVKVQTDKGTYTMADLGLTIPDAGRTLPVGTQTPTVSANPSGGYSVSGNLSLTIKVSKATPELSNVKGSTITNESKLSSSRITGSAVNPYTKRPVEGTWEWVSPEQIMRCTSGTQQNFSEQVKFIPTDSTNYMEARTSAGLTVLSSGGSGGGGGSAVAGDPQLKVSGGTWTYDRTPHGPIVSTVSAGNQTITYTNQATRQSTTTAPVDAGTYDVKVELAATPSYKAATGTATITINQRIASLKTTGDAIQDRPYNGKRDAVVDKGKILLDNVYREDGLTLSIGEVTATYGSENVGEYTVLIQCPGAKISGAKAANYMLPNTTVSERSTILKRPARVDFNGTLTKEYGETFNFDANGNSYTIEPENASQQRGVLAQDKASISLTSTGAAATASVGTYSVSALGAGANYDLQLNGNAKLQVTKATPHLMGASAGSGKTGAKLSSIPVPTVTYVNGHNGEPVPGTVAWADPNQTIGGARTYAANSRSAGTYTYTFSPSNLANYESVTGTVEVTATAKTPVNIVPTRTTFTYDGLPHEVSVNSTTTGANVTTTYKPSTGGSWSATPPTAVGQYDFKVTADLPDSAEYADNELSGIMTISPITPTGQPKLSGSGATLSAYKLDASTITGVDGKAVRGTVSWDNPGATVKAGDKYAWTFKSGDSNYNDAHGTVIPQKQANAETVDTSRLQAAITKAYETLHSAKVSSNGLELPKEQLWVTNAVNDLLLTAINSANNCLSEGGSTQGMIDSSIANLNSAVENFRNAMKPGLKGTDQPVAEKTASTVVLPAMHYEMKPGDKAISIKVSGTGNGKIFALSDNNAVAAVDVTGDTVVVKALEEGTAVVTVGREETDTHTSASSKLGVVVGEAPEGYVPPTEESVDATKPVTEAAPEPTVRVCNPYNGKHLLVSQSEANELVSQGWNREDAYVTALKSETPVYRLYNPYTYEHLYTIDSNEYETLKKIGWNDEGLAFYSDDNQAVPVHRLFNPWAGDVSAHHYTNNETEYRELLALGWQDESIGWYYVAAK